MDYLTIGLWRGSLLRQPTLALRASVGARLRTLPFACFGYSPPGTEPAQAGIPCSPANLGRSRAGGSAVALQADPESPCAYRAGRACAFY